jgi:hypothetical protein
MKSPLSSHTGFSNICKRATELALFATLGVTTSHTQQIISGEKQRVAIEKDSGSLREVFYIKDASVWREALSTDSPVIVRTEDGIHSCPITQAAPINEGLLITGDCGVGIFEQRLMLTAEDDVLDVATRFEVKPGVALRSVEDRYDFMPPRHAAADEHSGPLDFVWSQNIKSEAGDLIPTNCFKSPVVMMQQGNVFAALMPRVNSRHEETRALDLDLTSGERPWMVYGAIPSEPHDHSYFRRAQSELITIANTVEYRYSLVLSAQEPRLGYRRVVRRLWSELGHPALLDSADEQQNALRPELYSFASWREEAWHGYADRVYVEFTCGDRQCGTLTSDRNYLGDWDHPEPDAWFNAWFQTLRTAYGWYLHGRSTHDARMMAKAENVLNLALTAPRREGAFASIYLVNQHKWVTDEGWASYADSYHAFSMSWTAYWMLRWTEDLTPRRKAEVLRFVKPYGEFLLAHQQASGVIPAWYDAATLKPRVELRDFNAETAPSALLLAELGKSSGDQRYTVAAERAMSFIEREVLPRQRWFDMETFLSCARKNFDFFDKWTAQYPQNNLAEMEAPQAMLLLYETTHKRAYLESGERMLDYLLLTQQVWNNPQFTPKLLGGFTTQNTDAEWSDARQSYAATLLNDYYQATGRVEYLERAVAAARSTFAVAPWENWAHSGYPDEPGSLTGFHWGTGSAMASVEMLAPSLGDALIDVEAKRGVGFDECTITDVAVKEDAISFRIASPATRRSFLVRFRGVQAARLYKVSWNEGEAQTLTGKQLLKRGIEVEPLL